MLETLTENGQGNIRLGLVKPNLKRLRLNREVREVIEMNNKWAERT